MKQLTYLRPFAGDPVYGDLVLRSANGIWCREYEIVVKRKKLKRYESYGTRDELVAKETHGEKRKEAFVVGDKRNAYCADVFEEYIARLRTRKLAASTIASYQSAWRNNALAVLGPVRVRDVESEHVLEVLDGMRERERLVARAGAGETLSDATVRLNYAMLSGFFTFCIEFKYRDQGSHPARLGKTDTPKVPKPKEVARTAVFSPEEIDRIANHVGRCVYARYWDEVAAYKRETFVRLSPLIGTRISEALAITLNDVVFGRNPHVVIDKQIDPHYDRRGAWFVDLKGRVDTVGERPRNVPLHDDAVELLEGYIERGLDELWLVEGGLLFPSQEQTPMRVSRLALHLKNASAAVGRPVKSHYFRHTYISTKLAGGASIDQVAQYAGNTPLVIAQYYRHWIEEETATEAYRNIGAVPERKLRLVS